MALPESKLLNESCLALSQIARGPVMVGLDVETLAALRERLREDEVKFAEHGTHGSLRIGAVIFTPAGQFNLEIERDIRECCPLCHAPQDISANPADTLWACGSWRKADGSESHTKTCHARKILARSPSP